MSSLLCTTVHLLRDPTLKVAVDLMQPSLLIVSEIATFFVNKIVSVIIYCEIGHTLSLL